jgi:hypothetical protein
MCWRLLRLKIEDVTENFQNHHNYTLSNHTTLGQTETGAAVTLIQKMFRKCSKSVWVLLLRSYDRCDFAELL